MLNFYLRLQNTENFALSALSSFCHKANDFSTLFSAKLEHHQTIKHFPSPQWQLSTPHKKQISTSVSGIVCWADDIDLKCQSSLKLIPSYQDNYTIYTNGSTNGGRSIQSVAVVVTRGSTV